MRAYPAGADGDASAACAKLTAMAHDLKKRSFALAGHRTSLALEPEFWAVLERAAAARGLALARLIEAIDDARGEGGRALASACRVFALAFAQNPQAGFGEGP